MQPGDGAQIYVEKSGGRRGHIPGLLQAGSFGISMEIEAKHSSSSLIFPRMSPRLRHKRSTNAFCLKGGPVFLFDGPLTEGSTNINIAKMQKPQTTEVGLIHVMKPRKNK